MKNIIRLFFLAAVFLFYSFIYTKAHSLTVPFQSITINPNHQLVANYTFGTHQGIFCYDLTFGNVGKITFPRNGDPVTFNLPLILTNKTPIEDGQPADPFGLITILNTQKIQIFISCDFIF